MPERGGLSPVIEHSNVIENVDSLGRIKKFKCELLDEQSGDSAGIKSATFMVNGPILWSVEE